MITFGSTEWVDELAALANEIHETNRAMHGGIDDLFWRDAAWRQAYGQIDALMEYAARWDAIGGLEQVCAVLRRGAL